MLNTFGSNYGEIGDLKENLIFKTAGKIKIQIGKSFIDLIDNNGNINIKTQKLIKSISSLDEIKSDGIYYFDGKLIISVNEEQIPLTTENGTTYVSFIEKQEVSENQKHIALKNIGFLYDSLEEIDSITGSIIYVESEKSLYIVQDGKLTKYFVEIPNPYPKQFVITNENQESIGALVITGEGTSNSIHLDGLDIYMDNYCPNYISNNNHIFQINNKPIVKITLQGIESNSIKSPNANSEEGFRLYNESGESTLEVDNLIVRNGINDTSINLLPVEYYKEENIILSIDEIGEENDEEFISEDLNEEDIEEELELKLIQFVVTSIEDGIIVSFENQEYEINLKYQNTFQVGDKLQIFTDKDDLTQVHNVICCLVERNSKLNNDLVIGKIGNQYNEKSFGIYSKQNIFYSAKFDLDGEGSEKINYPFYSDSLYKNLQLNLNNSDLKPICLPLGLSVYNNFINGSNSILKLINRLEDLEKRILNLENKNKNLKYAFRQENYLSPLRRYDNILQIHSSFEENMQMGSKNFIYSGYIGEDIVDELSIVMEDPALPGLKAIGIFFVLIKYKKNESPFERHQYLIFKQNDSNLELTIEIIQN